MNYVYSKKEIGKDCFFENLIGVDNQQNLVKTFCEFIWSDEWKAQSKNFHFMPTILLYGPPGTGKTSILKKFANGLNNQSSIYYRESLDLLVNKDLGETSKAIKSLFDELKDHAACGKKIFLQIDDVDSLLSSRYLTNESSGVRRGVNTFITQLDELLLDESRFSPIISATTNMFDKLDLAVKRRFSLKLEVNPKLNLSEIKKLISPMIKIILPEININYEKIERLTIEKMFTPSDLILVMQTLFLRKRMGIEVTESILWEELNQAESSIRNFPRKNNLSSSSKDN